MAKNRLFLFGISRFPTFNQAGQHRAAGRQKIKDDNDVADGFKDIDPKINALKNIREGFGKQLIGRSERRDEYHEKRQGDNDANQNSAQTFIPFYFGRHLSQRAEWPNRLFNEHGRPKLPD
ncbi:MAG: hypothetical protein PHN49_12050, partial [Candidatus Omnitrophica bacterium]|nr:hypothetical protein [Candidatus Omnitrophota bacterium]